MTIHNDWGTRIDAKHGLFSGSFLLKDPNPAQSGKTLQRAASFFGVLEAGTMQREGYFLLPQLPDPSATPPITAKDSPILSGEVLLAPK